MDSKPTTEPLERDKVIAAGQTKEVTEVLDRDKGKESKQITEALDRDKPETLKRDLGQEAAQIVDKVNIDPSKRIGPQIDPNVIFRENLKNIFGDELKNIRVMTISQEFKKQLGMIVEGHRVTVAQVLQNDIYEVEEASEVDTKIKQSIDTMKEINDMNWQYAVIFKNGKQVPINDFESMLVGKAFDDIWVWSRKKPEDRENPPPPKTLKLLSIKLQLNLYSSVITNPKKEVKLMRRNHENNRFDRVRPPMTSKPVVDQTKRKEGFTKEIAAFARAWGREYKNNEFAFPCFEEMMAGIFQWYNDQLNKNLQGKTPQEQVNAIKYHKTAYNQLISKINITKTNVPLTQDDDPEIGMHNPYSKISCFVLYAYSMEFGEPPLYLVVNNAARDMQLSFIPTLGPYAKVLGEITARAEQGREDFDKIMTGKYIEQNQGGVANNISEIFLLWRGAQMKEDWLRPYYQSLGKNRVNLPGNTSCSRSLKVALQYATRNPRKNHSPVLFVISCRNYTAPFGIRMNNEAFTAFPSEGEFLLSEGCGVFVIEIEKDVLIDNQFSAYDDFRGNKLIIIHMYHHGI